VSKGQPLPKDLRKAKYWTVYRILKKAGPRKYDTLESCTRQYAFVLIDIYKILSDADVIKTTIGHAISTIFDLRCDLYSKEENYTSATWYTKMKTFLDNMDDKNVSITKHAVQTDGMSCIHNRLDRFNDLLIALSKVEKALLSYKASNETPTSTDSTFSTTNPTPTPTLSHPYFFRHFLAELKSNNDDSKEEKDITKKTTKLSISRKATNHGRRRG
jgi:hypothetical protein